MKNPTTTTMKTSICALAAFFLFGILHSAFLTSRAAAQSPSLEVSLHINDGGEIATFKQGERVFTNRNHTLATPPAALDGMSFLRVPIEGVKIRCTAPGEIFVLTPPADPGSIAPALLASGFAKETRFRDFQLYGKRIDARVSLYRKKLKEGDTLKLGRWSIVLGFARVDFKRISYTQGRPPGLIINHSPGNSGIYLGSPSICILPNGDYVASHDAFGPKSTERQSALTRIFTSSDRGVSWREISVIHGVGWSNLFVHDNVLYNMGIDKHPNGSVVIRKSTDGGKTWTNPVSRKTGLLWKGNYHTGPMPMVVHQGRIWRAFEIYSAPPSGAKRPQSIRHYSVMLISAPVNADLLDADNWSQTDSLIYDPAWLDGSFMEWIEGNAVVTPGGKLVNVLRVGATGDYAAIVEVSDNGKTLSFNPDNGFVKIPGGYTKFTIRHDPQTNRYWTINNVGGSVGRRNILLLSSSADLRSWVPHGVLLSHPDKEHHAFQYIDWQFDGNDIIFASRTAFDDETGGAHTYHDSNYLTFHRIKDFRLAEKTTLDLEHLQQGNIQPTIKTLP